jgi:hypothetical protein
MLCSLIPVVEKNSVRDGGLPSCAATRRIASSIASFVGAGYATTHLCNIQIQFRINASMKSGFNWSNERRLSWFDM